MEGEAERAEALAKLVGSLERYRFETAKGVLCGMIADVDLAEPPVVWIIHVICLEPIHSAGWNFRWLDIPIASLTSVRRLFQ